MQKRVPAAFSGVDVQQNRDLLARIKYGRVFCMEYRIPIQPNQPLDAVDQGIDVRRTTKLGTIAQIDFNKSYTV